MKAKLFTILLLILLSLNSSAQDEKIHQEKMKVFDHWIGGWKGSGWTQAGPGDPKHFAVDEEIQSKLSSTILLIEGIGKGTDSQTNKESIVHHALAILSYDPATDQYKFKSHLKNGRSTDAWFTVLGDDKFQWGFDTPQGKVRYSIVIDPLAKIWHEVGEFSSDNNNWRKFIEMNLKKK